MKKELRDESQNIFCQVEYWNDKTITYANWIGNGLVVEQIKEGAMLMLEYLRESKTTFVLNDTRHVIGSWDEANDWIANEWMPKAVEMGLRKFAHVVSDDLFAQLSAEFMEDNSKKIDGGFQMRLFDNLKEAEKWLSE